MSAPVRQPFKVTASEGFTSWLLENDLSLALTTYQTGRLFLIGVAPNGELSIYERQFKHALALTWADNTLLLASEYEIWRLQNMIPYQEKFAKHYDACYVPHVCYVTGKVGVRDIAMDHTHRIIFANSLFNCLAVVSEFESFTPIWRPPFISSMLPEDRCHVNGLALVEGRPKYVSMLGESDVAQGWRERRVTGGLVYDIDTNKQVLRDLSLPHSPRYHQNQLYLLESGTGYLGYLHQDRSGAGQWVRQLLCPGFARGLSFHKHYAVIGVSQFKAGQHLPAVESIRQAGMKIRCGLVVADLKRNQIVHELSFEGGLRQVFAVTVLPGLRTPMLLGIMNEARGGMIRAGGRLYCAATPARKDSH